MTTLRADITFCGSQKDSAYRQFFNKILPSIRYKKSLQSNYQIVSFDSREKSIRFSPMSSFSTQLLDHFKPSVAVKVQTATCRFSSVCRSYQGACTFLNYVVPRSDVAPRASKPAFQQVGIRSYNFNFQLAYLACCSNNNFEFP